MNNRQSSIGWTLLAVAYVVAVLPIEPSQHLIWSGIAAALAYFVLARRTTIQTVQLAQEHPSTPIVYVWRQAMQVTLKHRLLLIIPTFALMLVAAAFLRATPPYCPGLFRAYCMISGSMPEWHNIVIVGAGVALFLLLDHALLVALALMSRRYFTESAVFVGNTAVGLRFALACAILSMSAVSVNILEFSTYKNWISPDHITERRVVETLYPALEPLVTNGIFWSANLYNRSDRCADQYGRIDQIAAQPCTYLYDTRPFIARQIFVASLSALMYGLLIAGILRLSRPDTHKAKRGSTEDV